MPCDSMKVCHSYHHALSVFFSNRERVQFKTPYFGDVIHTEVSMFTDPEDDIIFFALKSLNWSSKRSISASTVLAQIQSESKLREMHGYHSVIEKLNNIEEEGARQHLKDC